MKCSIAIFLSIFYFTRGNNTTNYNRTELQAEFPGFGDEWIALYNENNEVVLGFYQKPARLFGGNVKESVSFKLYTRIEPNGLEAKSFSTLECTSYNKDKPTKFVTHGWMSSGKAFITIKDGFLQKYDANVFIMDWSPIAGNVLYPVPMQATSEVAEYYSDFLNDLIKNGLDPKNIHLVGHSLGAHISGFAGRRVKSGKIGRITALDPALPGFNIGLVKGGHLKKSDASFVDVIHTCAGFLGIEEPLGHADFYPNGGDPPQPGCESLSSLIEACSHGRSWLYFAESLKSTTPFMAQNCKSYKHFLSNSNCKDTVPMGDPAPVKARGNYYLRTDSRSPYALL